MLYTPRPRQDKGVRCTRRRDLDTAVRFRSNGMVCSIQAAARAAAWLFGSDALRTKRDTGALLLDINAKKDAGIDDWKLTRPWRDNSY